MVHPLKFYEKDTEIKNMDQIEANLEICTLYKGVPHGLSIIKYTDPWNKVDLFRGVGIF